MNVGTCFAPLVHSLYGIVPGDCFI